MHRLAVVGADDELTAYTGTSQQPWWLGKAWRPLADRANPADGHVEHGIHGWLKTHRPPAGSDAGVNAPRVVSSTPMVMLSRCQSIQ